MWPQILYLWYSGFSTSECLSVSSDWSVLTKTFAVVLEECKLLYSYSCKKKKLKVDLSWELHFLDFFFPPLFSGGRKGKSCISFSSRHLQVVLSHSCWRMASLTKYVVTCLLLKTSVILVTPSEMAALTVMNGTRNWGGGETYLFCCFRSATAF